MKNKINILEKDINIINKLQKGTSLQKRACQIFQILLLNKKFKNFIYKIRKEMKIPISGLNLSDKDEKDIVKNRFFNNDYILYNNEFAQTPELFFDDKKIISQVNKFIKEENILELISTNADNDFLNQLVFSIIKEYSILNDLIHIKDGVGMIYRTDYEKDAGFPNELIITVSPTVTKEEFIDYINAKWEEIKFLQKSILGEEKVKKRLKLSKYFARDIKIYNKYRDLLEKKSRGEIDFKYIDIEIAKEFGGLDEGTIRSIISKINKLVKSVNEKKEQDDVADKGEVLF